MESSRKVVNGHFHQGQIISNMSGNQCTAIALYALLTAYSLSSLSQSTLLTTHIVDDIVINGHQLYQEIISHSNNQTPRYLGHWEIPRNLQHGDDDVLVHSYQNVLFGSVGVNHTIVHGTVNIKDAFPLAFSISNYFLCTFGASTIAVFLSQQVRVLGNI